MTELKYFYKRAYDEKYKMTKDKQIVCYSKKKLQSLYESENDYKIVGEACLNNKKRQIAELIINEEDEPLKVSRLNANSKVLYQKVGYVYVGHDRYVALIKSRVPFLIAMFILILGILVGLFLFWKVMFQSVPVVDPDHPLPDNDTHMEKMEDDDTEKVHSDGGAVSMIYTLSADLNLTTEQANIYFKNPNASNHDVMLHLCIVEDETLIPVAKSGLLKAGYALYTMDMMEDTVRLNKGTYDAAFVVYYYDPLTGEKALVESTIEDVTLNVIK